MHTAPAQFGQLVELGLREVLAQPMRRLRRLTAVPAVFRATGLNLRITPLVRGNPETALLLYKGEFAFSGTAVKCNGRQIFDHDVPDSGWMAELHGFSWLRHLEADGRELCRVQARTLISDWIERHKKLPPTVWQTNILARRVLSWLHHAPFLLKGASQGFEKRFFRTISRETRRLPSAIMIESRGRPRLNGAIALASASVMLSGLEATRPMAFERLAAELEGQILPDGGHVSRNPADILDILLDLVPIRSALEAARMEVPAALNASLERMLPMLRFFLHGDGGLATFNGVGDIMAERARRVLEADGVRGRPVQHAVHTGYCRLAAGKSLVIMDVGRPPAPGLNRQAAAAPLAFEFSSDTQRIVVNCGSPMADVGEWSGVSRMTAAHSTVSFGEACAGHVYSNRVTERVFGSPAIVGPATVDADFKTSQAGAMIEASHDGYSSSYGLSVRRRLYLAANGTDLRGEDSFSAAPGHEKFDAGAPFAIRFHLHPSVKVMQSKSKTSVTLLLPNKQGWQFSVRGGFIDIEDSIYLAGMPSPRRIQQIVVKGLAGERDRINWAFRRIEQQKPDKGAGDGALSPELPL